VVDGDSVFGDDRTEQFSATSIGNSEGTSNGASNDASGAIGLAEGLIADCSTDASDGIIGLGVRGVVTDIFDAATDIVFDCSEDAGKTACRFSICAAFAIKVAVCSGTVICDANASSFSS
jgi:hypothetical protein